MDTAVQSADLIIGRRLRALRLEQGLSLAELAGRAGMSIGALSQIERGLSSLRVRVMWPLAAALKVDPSALVADPEVAVSDLYCVRAGQRRGLPVRSEGIAKDLLSPPGATLTGMVVRVDPGGGTAGYAHDGHEFGIVTSGEVELVIDGARYLLRQGDSFAFPSRLTHSFRNPTEAPAEVVWVNTIKPPAVSDGQ